jgi:hypothetical protein
MRAPTGTILLLAASGLLLGTACDLPGPLNPGIDPADGFAEPDGPGDRGHRDPAGPESDGIGQLEVLIHDAPTVAVDQVWIRFDEVKVENHELGWLVLSEETTEVELLSLQNGVVDSLGLADLPVGSYGQIRLHIADSWVVVGGETFPLTIPSGDASGLKIGSGFQLEDCGMLSVTLDWDAGAHLMHNAQGYKLSPVIEVESMSAVGDCSAPDDGAGESGGAESGSGSDGGDAVPDPDNMGTSGGEEEPEASGTVGEPEPEASSGTDDGATSNTDSADPGAEEPASGSSGAETSAG